MNRTYTKIPLSDESLYIKSQCFLFSALSKGPWPCVYTGRQLGHTRFQLSLVHSLGGESQGALCRAYRRSAGVPPPLKHYGRSRSKMSQIVKLQILDFEKLLNIVSVRQQLQSSHRCGLKTVSAQTAEITIVIFVVFFKYKLLAGDGINHFFLKIRAF